MLVSDADACDGRLRHQNQPGQARPVRPVALALLFFVCLISVRFGFILVGRIFFRFGFVV
jgi:hypothetical protein